MRFLMNLFNSNFRLFAMSSHTADTCKKYGSLIDITQKEANETVPVQQSIDRIHGVRVGVDRLRW
jgi:hypothetical protein